MNVLMAIGGAILTILLIAVIMAAPVMWLWDWLMPTLFGLGEITLWQSLGLLFLCQMLFTRSTTSN